jgi:hypothetical protein
MMGNHDDTTPAFPSDYQIGKLAGSIKEIHGVVSRIETNQTEIWTQLNNAKDDLGEVRRSVNTLEGEIKRLEYHIPAEKPAIVVLKPWEKPVGEIMFVILMKAIQIVSVGAIVALIVIGVASAKL